MPELLRVRGARVHNLKNISIDLPHNALTVVTGVSGSGKSSLVFDTIYAEGQRRYVESLSAYARQFLDRMEKPAVDEIDGISPPIAIRQKNTTRNPRSTVATATEIYDFLRLLYARAGETWCPDCDKPVVRDTVDPVAAAMAAQVEGTRWYALFPVKVDGEAGEQALKDELFDLRKRGFTRLYQNARIFEFSTPESLLEIDFKQPVFVLVDRLVIRGEMRQRLVDTVEICYREAGEVIFEQAGETEPQRLRFSERFACKTCGREFLTPEPSLFSFNNPYGACPQCQGFGNTIDYDMELVIPDPSKSLNEGAVDPWTKPNYDWGLEECLSRMAGRVRTDVAYADMRPAEKALLRDGVRRFFREVEKKKYKVHVRVFLSRYRGYTECNACGGARLREEALFIRVGGKTIAEVSRMNITEALDFFAKLTLAPEQAAIADKVLLEIRQRLQFLNDVGLEYLTLDRLSMTLSGGEAQRITLAACLGSRLVGATYVLDEPSIGLHSRDTGRLIRILHDLRDLGNTILVVEHDADVMRAADHIVDMGPGAGELGGQITFEGTLKAMLKTNGKNGPKNGSGNGSKSAAGNGSGRQTSLTAKYLNGDLKTSLKTERRSVDPKRMLQFWGCRGHNLKNIDVTVPLGLMTVVTGVSGSGKSTLVHDVINKALASRYARELNSDFGEVKPKRKGAPAEDATDAPPERQVCRQMTGAGQVKEVVLVDQSPIGRTPRSNPVTYTKAFDPIRELFAATPEADRRGFTPGHFSFNIAGGRCETCQGDGTVTVEMQFLADVELICEDCRGTRYKQSILDIRYRGLNIHDVLQLTIQEALTFFADQPRIVSRLKPMADVGLGYLRLGQSATTLSGGEAQRVKLASHLTQTDSKGILYLFDEPTTGLHFDDITKLLDAFDRLIRKGASLLIIEHNLEVIRHADWLIDLGPDGGEGGGRVVVAGTPETVAECEASWTGKYLRPMLTP
ncbi:MAG: excinuclease ABC subunit A [Bryobacteraceae bacterium]|nr:excinuclease ABC subunit A [Bryobacteraceae bacterium]